MANIYRVIPVVKVYPEGSGGTTLLLYVAFALVHDSRGIEIVNFTNFARTISRHADGISRYSVPPSAGPLLPLSIIQIKLNQFKKMPAWSLTYKESVFKRCHSDKHFSEFYLQDGGKNQRALIGNKITSLSPGRCLHTVHAVRPNNNCTA